MPLNDVIALTDLEKVLVSGGVGAVVASVLTGLFGLYAIAAGRNDADRNRRRDLYSEAYKVALQWCEGVYRVRRRASDRSTDRDLVRHFHDMQERISYYEGWLAMEAPELGRAYRALLGDVRSSCEPLVKEAWDRPGREPTTPTPENEKGPDLSDAKAAFVRDVNEHLSRRPWVRRRVKTRYPKET
jgi:hypothetical protein